MKRAIGCCDLGEQVRNKGYVLLQYGRDSNSGSFCGLGPILHIPAKEMKETGLALVLDKLRHCPEIDPLKLPSANKVANQELLKIKRNHLIVAITLFEGDFLDITPLHGGRGWQFSSHEDEANQLELPATNDEFLEILVKAFEVAS